MKLVTLVFLQYSNQNRYKTNDTTSIAHSITISTIITRDTNISKVLESQLQYETSVNSISTILESG